MKFCAAAVGILFIAATALAADIDGNWSGSLHVANNEIPVLCTFKADSGTLTGSMAGIDGNPFPIEDGHYDGINISFSANTQVSGMTFKVLYNGQMSGSGDRIRLSGEFGGQPFEFVLMKQ